MARKIAGTINDPTLPKTPIEIGGKTYYLCFDFGALAEAETAINAEGHNVNLLSALPTLNLANTRIVFAAALRKFQPEISYRDALRLVNHRSLFSVATAILAAWEEAIPEDSPTGLAAGDRGETPAAGREAERSGEA